MERPIKSVVPVSRHRRAFGVTVAFWMTIMTSACGADPAMSDTTEVDELADFFARSPSCTENCGSGEAQSANIVTFDGLAYRVPAAGDYVLVMAEDRSVAVQVRFADGDAGGSVMTNVAAVLTDYPVEVDASGALMIDGRLEEVPIGSFIPLIDDAAIFREEHGYTLAWPGESESRFRLDVTINGDSMRLTPYLPPELAGSVAGLAGDGDGAAANDLTTRSGTTLDAEAPAEELVEFVSSWSVDPGESLFGCEPDEYSSKNHLDDFEFGC